MRSPVLLDANLALLLIVGSTDISYIKLHKRLLAYAKEDFALLVREIARHRHIVVTPNVLTETSSLLRQHAQPRLTEMSKMFAVLASLWDERYLPSVSAFRNRQFDRLGLTDAGLLELSEGGLELLTADLDLYLAAVQSGFSTRNFNHIREAGT